MFTCDIGGTVGIVLVHQSGRRSVEPGHRVHGTLVRLPDVVLGDHQFDPGNKMEESLGNSDYK
jgi:hypothetical protein